jgi:hypothetical protein
MNQRYAFFREPSGTGARRPPLPSCSTRALSWMACGAAAVTFDFENEDLIGVGHRSDIIRMADTATMRLGQRRARPLILPWISIVA